MRELLVEEFQSRFRPRDFNVGRRKDGRLSFIPCQGIVDVISSDNSCPRYYTIQPPCETISLRFNLSCCMVNCGCNLTDKRLNQLIVSRRRASLKR